MRHTTIKIDHESKQVRIETTETAVFSKFLDDFRESNAEYRVNLIKPPFLYELRCKIEDLEEPHNLIIKNNKKEKS